MEQILNDLTRLLQTDDHEEHVKLNFILGEPYILSNGI